MFKHNECDFGIVLGGVDYRFTNVQRIAIEDPERNALTRGSNGADKVGIAYRVGVSEAKRWTAEILDMSFAMKTALDAAYDNQTRMDVYAIDRKTGASKMARQAILANKPQQLTLEEGPESLQVSLEFETFDSSEKYKE